MGSLIYLNWYAGELSTAMIVANVPHLWPLIARIGKLGSFAQNSSFNERSQFTMQNMRTHNQFDPVGSEDNIIAGDVYSGKGGSDEVGIFTDEGKDEESGFDKTVPHITTTVAVT